MTRPTALSADDARGLVLRAQGLAGTGPKDATALLRRVQAVQLDTISVLARSHELVAYARLGPATRAEIERAYWGRRRAFEYYAHAACILPMDAWPSFGFRRRAQSRRLHRYIETGALTEVRAALRDGPVTASDVGGARRDASGWWNWSDAKRALEYLYYIGDAVVTTRTSWKRVYDLPERAVPPDILHAERDDADCYVDLVGRAAKALGVATAQEIADYYRLTWGIVGAAHKPRALITEAIEANGLVPVSVEGWADHAYVSPPLWRSRRAQAESRTALLSPFDSLIWDRPRTRRLFGFDLKLEAYTPRTDRVHGYFSMPLLAESQLVGRVDPAREGKTLVARRVVLHDVKHVEAAAHALADAARWVGCDTIRIDAASPAGALPLLRRTVPTQVA